jgi:DeoR family fructose operon transcriptional repressor
MFTQERREKICELIADRKTLTVNELCDLLAVSAATIRADLRDLDREGLLLRTHGGAIERSRTSFEQVTSKRGGKNLAAKRAIAQAALPFIEADDTIILDTGTTTRELARCLATIPRLTVVTNDLDIAALLEDSPDVELVLLGGILRKGYRCTFGAEALRALDNLRVDKAFIATNSLSSKVGATTPNLHHAQVKKAMIAIARQVILLCDSSKIGRESFARFATAEQIDLLITEQISRSARTAFENHGMEVVVANEQAQSDPS